MKKIWLYAAAIAAMTACSEAAVEDVTPEVEGGELVTITASSPSTRVAVDGEWNVTWESGDALAAVNTFTKAVQKFTLSDGAGTSSGTFTGTDNGECYLYYPSSLLEGLSGDEFHIDLTQQQEGVRYSYMRTTESADTSASPAIAMTHITAAFDLNMTFPSEYQGYTIQSVVVAGLASEVDYEIPLGYQILAPEQNPITITDEVTTVASDNTATVSFNALAIQCSAGHTITATAYLKSSTGTIAALTQTLTAASAVAFYNALHHTINCAAMAEVTTSWADNAASSYATANEISSAAELAKLAVDVNSGTYYGGQTFTLTADINLSGHEWKAIGGYHGGSTEHKFKGTFDGNGHTISGLYINDANGNRQALFGVIDGATIKNLSVSGSVVGGDPVGGIVAWMDGASEVSNCHSSCYVSGTHGAAGVVGYVGSHAVSPKIINCSNSGAVVCRGDSDVETGGVVGQVCGENTIIANCYNSGTVTALACGGAGIYLGGVVGSGSGATITNCYNSGVVTSLVSSDNDCIGSVAGYIGHITNCYYQDGTYSKGLGGGDTDNTTSYTPTQMTDGTLLGDLNTNRGDYSEWVEGTKGYPTQKR